jgi:hypothetical protein
MSVHLKRVKNSKIKDKIVNGKLLSSDFSTNVQ